MHRMKRCLLIASLLFILFLLLAVATWVQLNRWMDTPFELTEGGGVVYEVNKGSSLRAVAYDLAAQGYLKKPWWFIVYARLTSADRGIQAGEYALLDGLTPKALLTHLSAGAVHYYPLTVIEGWTIDQLLANLAYHSMLSGVDQASASWLSDNIASNYPSAEGLLFPDTYYYYKGMPVEVLLQQAHRRMQTILMREWEARAPDLPLATPYEALILASLIEKETAVDEERADIAGVFTRRLQRGMRLQTDVAVIYGLGSVFDGDLRVTHLRDASNPYNSYRHNGLPPTPIALPGEASIHAALNPAAGDALYFVAKGDGRHYFSATLAEHQKAVKKYQIEQRRKDYSSVPTGRPTLSSQSPAQPE